MKSNIIFWIKWKKKFERSNLDFTNWFIFNSWRDIHIQSTTTKKVWLEEIVREGQNEIHNYKTKWNFGSDKVGICQVYFNQFFELALLGKAPSHFLWHLMLSTSLCPGKFPAGHRPLKCTTTNLRFSVGTLRERERVNSLQNLIHNRVMVPWTHFDSLKYMSASNSVEGRRIAFYVGERIRWKLPSTYTSASLCCQCLAIAVW